MRQVDKLGGFALYYAAQFDCIESIKVLAELRADVNQSVPKQLDQNKDGKSVKVTSDVKFSALIKASDKGNVEAVKLLIELKSDIEWRDADGYTALHWAAQKSSTHNTCYQDTTKVLLDNKADPEAIDDTGYPALSHSCSAGDANVVKQILLAKANPDVLIDCGAYGESMLYQHAHWRRGNRPEEVGEMLLKALEKEETDWKQYEEEPGLVDLEWAVEEEANEGENGKGKEEVFAIVNAVIKEWTEKHGTNSEYECDFTSDVVQYHLTKSIRLKLGVTNTVGRTLKNTVGVTMGLTERAKAFACGFTKPCIRVFAASQNKTSSKVRFYGGGSAPDPMRYFIMEDDSFKHTRAIKNKDHFSGLNTALACAIDAVSSSPISLPLVTCLLEHGADPTIQDQGGDSALALALTEENTLPAASTSADTESRKLITEKVIEHTNFSQSKGQTELHLAVQYLNDNAVQCILKKMQKEVEEPGAADEVKACFKEICLKLVQKVQKASAKPTNQQRKRQKCIKILQDQVKAWA